MLVTGYLSGNLGLGEAARGYTAALQAAGVPVGDLDARARAARSSSAARGPVTAEQRAFAEVAMPDGARARGQPAVRQRRRRSASSREQAGEEALRSRYTIGQWAWETDAVPAWWDASFDLVDEVWVYSRYVAENLARATDVGVPVVVVPLPVTKPDAHGATVPVRAAGRLRVPVRVRLLLDARAQEPARAGRGVQARVRARRGPDAAAQDDQRALPPRGARAAAPRDRRPRRHPARRRDARARRDGRAVRSAPTPTCRCTAPRATASRWRSRWRSASP